MNQVHEAFNAQHITRELFQQFEGEGAPDVSQVPEAFLVVRMQVYSQLIQQYSSQIDMLDWDVTFSQVILKSFAHTSPEIKRLALQITL